MTFHAKTRRGLLMEAVLLPLPDYPSHFLFSLTTFEASYLSKEERRTCIANFITANPFDILCLCETWFDSSFRDTELFHPKYNCLRSERDASQHGGVLTAVRSSISHEIIPLSLPTGCCCVATTIQSNKPFVIVNAYNPPSGSNYRWQPSIFESILCQVKSSNSKLPVILTGDLNLSGINWEDNSTNSDYELKCIDFFMEHNLHQLNHSITTASKTLDLCLTDNPDLVISSLATDDAYLNNSPLSDHHPVSIKLNVSALAPPRKGFQVLQFQQNWSRRAQQGCSRFPFPALLLDKPRASPSPLAWMAQTSA